jgi:hypothetical protein
MKLKMPLLGLPLFDRERRVAPGSRVLCNDFFIHSEKKFEKNKIEENKIFHSLC